MTNLKRPVVFNYDFQRVIGFSTIEDDGTLSLKITDPEVVALVKYEREQIIKALSVSPSSAVPAAKATPKTTLKDFPDELVKALEEVDRNARAYGFEIGKGQDLSEEIFTSDDNPFMDTNWRELIEAKKYTWK